jgi:membrane protein implicated in regulation of membrane protease activity
MLMPGLFLLWLAAAAALTGAIDLVFGLGWQGEVITFAVLSLLLVLATWKWVMDSRRMKSDQPTLNQRHHAYVGKVVPLAQPIVNGSGKVRIDDALWDVDGPNLPQGALVRIAGVDGLRLKAEKA